MNLGTGQQTRTLEGQLAAAAQSPTQKKNRSIKMGWGMRTLRIIALILLALAVSLSLACGDNNKSGNAGSIGGSGDGGGGTGGTGSGGGSGSSGSGGGAATQFVYTANMESFDISGFSVDSSGKLTRVPGSPYTTHSQAPFLFTPVALARVGNLLLSESFSPFTQSGIESYSINTSTGALTLLSPASGTAQQSGFFATGGYLGTNPLVSVVYAGGQSSTTSGSTTAQAVAAFSVDANGNLTQLGSTLPVVAGDLKTDAGGHFLFTAAAQQVWAIQLNADGSLATKGVPVTLQGTAATRQSEPCWITSQSSVAVAPAGNFLYTACGGVTWLNVLSVASDGTLTPVQAVHDAEYSSVALNPQGNLLAATDESANQVALFSVDTNTGMLTKLTTAPAGTRPNSLTFDSTGTLLLVTNGSSVVEKANIVPGSDNISVYTVSAQGQLSEVAGSPFATGTGPRSITLVKP